MMAQLRIAQISEFPTRRNGNLLLRLCYHGMGCHASLKIIKPSEYDQLMMENIFNFQKKN